MEKQVLYDTIKKRDQLDETDLLSLRRMEAVYPWFSIGRSLLLQCLYQIESPDFDSELLWTSLTSSDRKHLYELLHAYKSSLTEAETEDSFQLIDSFLESKGELGITEDTLIERSSVSIDYLSWSKDQKEKKEEEPLLSNHDLIDDYLAQEKKGPIVSKSTKEISKPTIADKNDDEEVCLTETLARIYINQGRYDRALQIIRKLSLHNPTKNAFFADQIDYLEKLIINTIK
ncbi:MAG: hypothetical protein M0P33_05270 [Massilibacteroides sp.]|nr:hypothetical protein [Massilibacteroides sp.]